MKPRIFHLVIPPSTHCAASQACWESSPGGHGDWGGGPGAEGQTQPWWHPLLPWHRSGAFLSKIQSFKNGFPCTKYLLHSMTEHSLFESTRKENNSNTIWEIFKTYIIQRSWKNSSIRGISGSKTNFKGLSIFEGKTGWFLGPFSSHFFLPLNVWVSFSNLRKEAFGKLSSFRSPLLLKGCFES